MRKLCQNVSMNIRLSQALFDSLESVSKAQRRPKSAIIRHLLEAYLSNPATQEEYKIEIHIPQTEWKKQRQRKTKKSLSKG